jgi:uncharacterized protein YjiK
MLRSLYKNWFSLTIAILIVIAINGLCSCKNDNNIFASKFQEIEETNNSATQSSKKNRASQTNDLYDVLAYEKIYLTKELQEISGLSIDPSKDELFAVNDEKAIIYRLSKDGKIKSKIDFGKNGDYEGIEKVNNSIYILKSNGNLIEYDSTKSNKIEIYKNELSSKNDTEGLGYAPSINSLLIACKSSPNIGDSPKMKKTKAVYAFDLKTKNIINKPIVTITDLQIKNFLEETRISELSDKVFKKRLERASDFSPSAIATNPIDDNYYILSTIGKTLIVIDQSSKIKTIYFLDDKAYIQPEGISFERNGDMWISNEGKSQKGNILKISISK